MGSCPGPPPVRPSGLRVRQPHCFVLNLHLLLSRPAQPEHARGPAFGLAQHGVAWHGTAWLSMSPGTGVPLSSPQTQIKEG